MYFRRAVRTKETSLSRCRRILFRCTSPYPEWPSWPVVSNRSRPVSHISFAGCSASKRFQTVVIYYFWRATRKSLDLGPLFLGPVVPFGFAFAWWNRASERDASEVHHHQKSGVTRIPNHISFPAVGNTLSKVQLHPFPSYYPMLAR